MRFQVQSELSAITISQSWRQTVPGKVLLSELSKPDPSAQNAAVQAKTPKQGGVSPKPSHFTPYHAVSKSWLIDLHVHVNVKLAFHILLAQSIPQLRGSRSELSSPAAWA